MAEFSGTGNTRYLGAVLEHAFKAADHTVERVALERQPLTPVLPECDLVLIGAPVYHCEPPRNVVRYLRSLEGHNLPLAMYFSLGLYSGDCARILWAHAEAAGFRPIGSFEAKFPGSDFVALSRRNSLFARMNRRVTRDLKDRALRFVSDLKVDAEPVKPAPKWYGPLNSLANRVAVPAYQRHKEELRADPTICTRGFWCVANCPVHAIRPHEGAIAFDPKKCIFCLRCYHCCPHGAIRIGNRRQTGTYPGPQIARNFESVPEYAAPTVSCERSRSD